ncbi:hypothetical protein [Pseudomonas sp. LRF_L74]|uniref:hypothetical protein n=1 Tax=Pseudomonas sp. LRF_L74 TaxID=3369422 RepID=UPI003F621A75
MRALLLLTIAVFLAACSHQHRASGYLFTKDGAELVIEEGVALKRGHANISFDSSKPTFSGKLTLSSDQGGQFSTAIKPENYITNRSVELPASQTGLNYDMRLFWASEDGENITRDESRSCTTAGYCSKEETYLNCNGRAYSAGSKRYEKNEDNENCTQERRTVQGNFPDCPGSQRVRNVYRSDKAVTTLSFYKPRATGDAFAEFTGETGFKETFEYTDSVEACEAGL